MAVTNITKSVLDRLKNQSKETGLPFQTVLQLFVQEEFLRRLSSSNHCDKFILKGGMFIYTLTNFESRPTRDVDFVLRSFSAELDNVMTAVQEVCEVDTGNDYIVIKPVKIEQIGFQKEYPGARVSLLATIGKARVPFAIDVGVDDVVVPAPSKRAIATRLPDFGPPEVYTYSLESAVAEKLDAILERMSLTSRMKDFYDIYYLSNTFDFEGEMLSEAISQTLCHRKRKVSNDVFDDIREFSENEQMLKHWSNFEPAKGDGLTFETVVKTLCNFLEPVFNSVVKNEEFSMQWSCKNSRWK